MKRTITTLAILAAAVTSAVASDLPSKISPAAPAPVFTQSNYYVGVNAGTDTATKKIYSGGITAGATVLPYLAAEAAYDFGYAKDAVKGYHQKTDSLALNVIPQYKVFGTDFTAYALAGVGYKYDAITSNTTKNDAFYNVGGGLKYEFVKNIDLDARYRYSDALKTTDKNSDQRITLGVDYKF